MIHAGHSTTSSPLTHSMSGSGGGGSFSQQLQQATVNKSNAMPEPQQADTPTAYVQRASGGRGGTVAFSYFHPQQQQQTLHTNHYSVTIPAHATEQRGSTAMYNAMPQQSPTASAPWASSPYDASHTAPSSFAAPQFAMQPSSLSPLTSMSHSPIHNTHHMRNTVGANMPHSSTGHVLHHHGGYQPTYAVSVPQGFEQQRPQHNISIGGYPCSPPPSVPSPDHTHHISTSAQRTHPHHHHQPSNTWYSAQAHYGVDSTHRTSNISSSGNEPLAAPTMDSVGFYGPSPSSSASPSGFSQGHHSQRSSAAYYGNDSSHSNMNPHSLGIANHPASVVAHYRPTDPSHSSFAAHPQQHHQYQLPQHHRHYSHDHTHSSQASGSGLQHGSVAQHMHNHNGSYMQSSASYYDPSPSAMLAQQQQHRQVYAQAASEVLQSSQRSNSSVNLNHPSYLTAPPLPSAGLSSPPPSPYYSTTTPSEPTQPLPPTWPAPSSSPVAHHEQAHSFVTQQQDGGQLSGDGKQLIVNYLSPLVTTPELHKLFARFGRLDGARVIYCRDNGVTKGYGFVYYSDPAHARAAIAHMNGFELHGKWLKVAYSNNPVPLHCRSSKPHGSGGGSGGHHPNSAYNGSAEEGKSNASSRSSSQSASQARMMKQDWCSHDDAAEHLEEQNIPLTSFEKDMVGVVQVEDCPTKSLLPQGEHIPRSEEAITARAVSMDEGTVAEGQQRQ